MVLFPNEYIQMLFIDGERKSIHNLGFLVRINCFMIAYFSGDIETMVLYAYSIWGPGLWNM